jgi:hypothetical protein
MNSATAKGETRVTGEMEEGLGIIPPQRANQPVYDLGEFLSVLPHFGKEAARLREELRKDRALRREGKREAGC